MTKAKQNDLFKSEQHSSRPKDTHITIQPKASFIGYVYAAIFIIPVGLITLERVLVGKEYGWVVVFLAVVALCIAPSFLVADRITSNGSEFILSFRTGKKIVVPKSGLTKVDQAWDRFIAYGIASHVFGIMSYRNRDEICKFLKRNLRE